MAKPYTIGDTILATMPDRKVMRGKITDIKDGWIELENYAGFKSWINENQIIILKHVEEEHTS